MRIEFENDSIKSHWNTIKIGVLGGWIGALAGAVSTIPLGLVLAVIIQLSMDDRRGAGDEILAMIVALSLMGFGALCGGISGPIIAVMTRRGNDDSPS